MAEVPKELELDRLRNLVRGFDWEVTKQEFEGKKIIVTLEKTLSEPTEEVSAGPA